MNDQEFEEQRARIEHLIDRWCGHDFDLVRGWRVKFAYERSAGALRDVDGEPWQCAMSCSSDWKYLDATVTVYLGTTASQNDEELEETFVHECSHILVNEMREEGLPHEERVCTMVARALVDAREAGRQDAQLGPFDVVD